MSRIVAGSEGPRKLRTSTLEGLEGSKWAARFCAWQGASGRRYIATVYTVDIAAPKAGLPDFDGFVLIPVANRSGRREVLDVVAIERETDKGPALARALARGADEWHVHLLLAERGARDAMIADLLERHRGEHDLGACVAAVA